ncbi:EAL domain-containing protein [Pleomorphomonas sp. PLEO]|uniref:EAL domain-containing protein n=1 Tax=Pleomorphomonas sp. PLEO TaxID=3239306 RepID=UPI00351EA5FC
MMVAVVVMAGVRTPVWPADAVVVALLADRSSGDRLAGVAGALFGWLLFAWYRGGDAHFLLCVLLIRAITLGTGLWVIDLVRAWAERSHNEGLFEIAAALAATIFAPLTSLAVALLLSATGVLQNTPMPLSVWWGGATAAFAIFLPPLLYSQRDAARLGRRPVWLNRGVFAAVVVLFSVGALAATATLSEPAVFFVVPLLLASFVLRPVDMAILSGSVWFVTMVAAYGKADSLWTPMLMPLGVSVGTLLPIATCVLLERLRQRERDLAESENLFRRSMDDASIGVTIIGGEGQYLKVNAAFCAMTGYDEAELVGRGFKDITYQEDRDGLDSFRRGILDGTVRSFKAEKRYVRKSGEVFWVEVSIIVVTDPLTGQPNRLLSQVEDIDLKKRTLEAIAESESRWAFALENGQQGVWDVDKPGGRLYTSPTWKRMLGYEPEDVSIDGGDAWLELMHVDDRDRFLVANDAHERGDTEWLETEFRLRHKDGHWVWILDRGKAISRDADGRPLRIIGTHTDISRNKAAEREIQLLEERVRLAIEAGGIGLWSMDLATGVSTWNGETFGRMTADAAGRRSIEWLRFVHPEDRPSLSEMLHQATIDPAARVNTTCRLLSPARGLVHIRVLANQVTLSNGDRLLLGTAWDISEQVSAAQELRDEKERLRTTLHAISDGVIATDADGRVTLINPAAQRMTGLSETEAYGHPIEEVFQAVHDDNGHPAASCVRQAIETGKPVERLGTQVIDVRGREVHYIREAAAPITAGADGRAGAVLVFQDVSAERAMQRSLAHAATHDDLTGLANRRFFETRIQNMITAAREGDSRHGLLFVDLDRFKIVNDTAGHLAGDALLQEVARTMRSIVPISDCLARLGGDEFAVLVENCDRQFAAFVGEKLIDAIDAIRFTWEGKVYEIGASAGVSQVDATTASAEAVLAEADVACYAAKAAGRGRVSVFLQNTGEAQRHMSDFRMAARIRETIENGRFVLYAQEIRSIAHPETRGHSLELLIRMIDENGVVSTPDTFIPAAERFELMGTIDRWVLAKVIRDFGSAIMAVPDLRVAINLSANSLNDPTLWRYLTDLFQASRLSPSRVTLEITETAVINSFEIARDFIRAARSIGCRVSLDDFGSGLSSFTYLKSFDVDAIKIDGSFVHNMAGSAYDRTVVRAINEIGRELGVDVIAERIEDQATLKELAKLGVSHGQGYLFNRPSDFHAVLAGYALEMEADTVEPLRA